MEDLVLDGTFSSRIPSAIRREDRQLNEVSATPPPPQRPAPSLPEHAAADVPKDTTLEVSPSRPNSLLARSESPLSGLGRLGLIRGQHTTLRAELRQQQDATLEAKKSIAALRKLALRLAVRISVKEAKIETHAKALSRARMSQYMAHSSTRSMSTSQLSINPDRQFPLSPPLSPPSTKPLPALPRWDSSGRVTTVRFSPYTESLNDTVSSSDEKSLHLDASRASLKEELQSTQTKLAQLFESQALLRERYNLEKGKTRQLDAECQQTHAKISTLEQSKQHIEEEARALHGYVEELEDANQQLRTGLKTAKLERHNIAGDLSKLQSSKLTLEHQLQAATGSKDDLEIQLQGLHQTSADVKKELEEKLVVLELESRDSSAAIAGLEEGKQRLDDDLRITKFRLSAAVDLEDQLRTQLSGLKDREFNLEHDLQLSRDTVAKLEEDLLVAYDKLSAMDRSVDELNAKLLRAEGTKMDHGSAATLAKASKQRINAHLQTVEKSRNKGHGKLRSTKSDLVLSKNKILSAETELDVLQGDLARVQQRNDELEALVEKAEVTLSAVVEKTNASVMHIEAIVADAKTRPFRNPFCDLDTTDTSLAVEQQLQTSQTEINMLHQTNAVLVSKLETMTEELHVLKSTSRSSTLVGETAPSVRSKISQRAGSPLEVMVAEEAYKVEVEQLKETRGTFERIVKSLQSKSAELEVLESWYEKDKSRVPSSHGSPQSVSIEHMDTLVGQALDVDAKGGRVRTSQPKFITPALEMTTSPHFREFGKRPRIKSVAADIETMPQIPDIETMPASPTVMGVAAPDTLGDRSGDFPRFAIVPIASRRTARDNGPLSAPPRRPPPIPIDIRKFDDTMLQKSRSETALKTLGALDQDRSFWRIGDISTIAGAGAGTPWSPHSRRRSVSMSDHILRKAKDSPMEQDWPPLPLSPSSPPPMSPQFFQDVRYGSPLSARFLMEEPYPPSSRAIKSTTSLVASSAVLPSPTSPATNVTSKQLPPRPQSSRHGSLPRNVIDKDLPRIPRRPVGGEEALKLKAKTTDDIPSNKVVWSLFPKPSDSPEVARSASSSGYYPFNTGPKKVSSPSALALVDEGRGDAQEADSRQPTPEPPSIGVVVTTDDAPEPAQIDLPASRTVKLKRSLSKLTGKSNRLEEHSPINSRKGIGFFQRPTQPQPLRFRQLSAPEQSKPSPLSPLSQLSPGHKAGTPTPTHNAVLSGVAEPVGIYDHVNKMWLTPQPRKSSHFGVFDPESKQFLLPAPRLDSLRQPVSIEASAAVSQSDVNRLSIVTEDEARDKGEEEEEVDGAYEEGEGALSLAEKLEIIRRRPSRLGHTPAPSSLNSWYSAAEDLEKSPKAVARPWKAGKILGLDRPPSSLMYTIEDQDDIKNESGEAKTSISKTGNGELVAEMGDTSKNWKERLRNVRMSRRSGNLRKSHDYI